MNRNRYHHPGPDPGAGGFTAELSFSLTVFDETENCTGGVGFRYGDGETVAYSTGWWKLDH